jgi:hypothetical protein
MYLSQVNIIQHFAVFSLKSFTRLGFEPGTSVHEEDVMAPVPRRQGMNTLSVNND